MDPWKILGIASTTDQRAIKIAYAKNLRNYHPEDDPAGFQRLREAYEKALEAAWYLKENKISADSNAFSGAVPLTPLDAPVEIKESFISKRKEAELFLPASIEDFIKDINELYDDFFKRIKRENWEDLFGKYPLTNIDFKFRMDKAIEKMLLKKNIFPNEIWLLFDELFNFLDREGEFAKRYSEDFYKFILDMTRPVWPMRYSFFTPDKDINYDRYIITRLNVYTAISNGDVENAKEFLEQAESLFNQDPDLYFLKAAFFLRTGNYNEAIEAYTKILEIEPESKDASLGRAHTYLRISKLGDALKDYQKVLSQDEENYSALYGLAEIYFKQAKWPEAILILEDLAERVPHDVRVALLLGQSEHLYGEELESAIKKNPFDKEIIKKLAELFLRLKKFEECENLIIGKFTVEELDFNLALILAQSIAGQERYESAEIYYNLALELAYKAGANNAEIIRSRGMSKLERKLPQFAIPDLKYVFDHFDADRELLEALALAYQRSSRSEMQFLVFKRWQELFPEDERLYGSRGYYYYNWGKYKEAITDFEKARTFPDSDESYLLLLIGRCYLRLSDKINAKKLFKEAIKVASYPKDNYIELAKIYLEDNENKKALKLLQKLLEIDPKHEEGLKLLALANEGIK